MKALITLIATFALLCSCKKDRTCTCTYDDGSTVKVTATNVSKKDAVMSCANAAPVKVDPRRAFSESGFMGVSCTLDK